MNAIDFLTDIPEETANRAFDGTSWFPEKRGKVWREAYAATLAEDYAELSSIAVQFGKTEELPAQFDRYREGYKRVYLAYLHSHSRLVSCWIAGPSNFPAYRMTKRADVTHKRQGEIYAYREHALKAIRRKLRPMSFNGISSADQGALELLETAIAERERLQERMKDTNAIIKRLWKQGREIVVRALIDYGYNEPQAYELTAPNRWQGTGYASYQLSNNSAEIRRLKMRLVDVTAKRAAPAGDLEGSAARVELAPTENRVRIHFPGKPDADTITTLKRNGFRWAPSLGAWSAYHNYQTCECAKRLAGIAA